MLRIYYSILFGIILLSIFLKPVMAQNPTYLLELRNDVQTSNTVYEFDVYLLRTGSTPLEYASGQFGLVINPLIVNGGAIIASIVSGSSDPILESTIQNPTSIIYTEESNSIKIAGKTPPGAGKGALISNVSPGTRICRVRLSNTNDFGQYQPDLTWTATSIYPTQISAYVGATNTLITDHSNHTTNSLTNPVLNVVTSSDVNSLNDFEFRVFPNPFRERITIDYKILESTHVRLSLIDANGKLIEHLVDKIQDAGYYTLPWVPVSDPAGVYVLKFQAGSFLRISRVTLIR